jgi:HAD superfamily hydrolase (TIGR01509 family)
LHSIELVIFDCDGVLVDTESLSARITSRALTELGWPLTQAEVLQRFLGCSETYFVAEVERKLGTTLPSDWESGLEPLYEAAYDTELTAVDGIAGVLAALDDYDVQRCVASNGSQAKMRSTLGRTRLYEPFAGRIFSAEEVANGKPAPDLYLHVAREMRVAPARCAVVEDSPRGVRAARAAGMHVFGYAALTPADQLRKERPNAIFASMAELPGLLKPMLRPAARVPTRLGSVEFTAAEFLDGHG